MKDIRNQARARDTVVARQCEECKRWFTARSVRTVCFRCEESQEGQASHGQ